MIDQEMEELEDFEVSVKRSPRKTETYVIDDISEINDVIKKVVGKVGREEVLEFMRLFKNNIEKQLDMISSGGQLTNEIKRSISRPKVGWEAGKLKASLIIDHPLAIAINDGTGIYGPENTPITPKNRKVMFIPKHKLKFYYMNRVKDTVKPKSSSASNFNIQYKNN
jgi:hypothetical protein